ncbi:hypothetical protein TWF696_009116 [Orbilia brochopaga]|uniref:Uncharacterized protein n=1 Tax=Orbilia brochopaga TaxID=3140254 RepID=A0AAV9UGJ0_9PEZI
MVAYKKSAASAILLGAAAVAAQNGTATVNADFTAFNSEPTGTATLNPDITAQGTATLNPDITAILGPDATMTYTTIIQSLCPTGLVDVPYTIYQGCPYGHPCVKPDIPYGWVVKTQYCAHGCGAGPTYVPVTECPWATPTPPPTNPNNWHKDEIVCPGTVPNEITTYTHYWKTPCPSDNAKPTPPPYYPEPPVTPPKQPPVCPGPNCPPQPPKPACEGPYCPDVVTHPAPPPAKPSAPCNTTVPPPPMYTGAGVKVAASGALGFIVIAAAAFL